MKTAAAQVAPTTSSVVEAKKAVKPTAGVSTKIDVSEQVVFGLVLIEQQSASNRGPLSSQTVGERRFGFFYTISKLLNTVNT